MSDGLAIMIPILVAIVFLGAIGFRLSHAIIKQGIPLLERLVVERGKGISGREASALRAEVSELQARMALLEGTDQRVDHLEEQLSFLQALLEKRSEEGRLKSGAG